MGWLGRVRAMRLLQDTSNDWVGQSILGVSMTRAQGRSVLGGPLGAASEVKEFLIK